VISDKKLLTQADNTQTEIKANDYFSPEVKSFSDMYPFGMAIKDRSWYDAGGDYRYGFQGQEGDPEIKGEGNSTNFKFRMHDPRIVRWKSIDSEVSQFADQSPYNNNFNNPISNSDPNGNYPWFAVAAGAWEYGTQVYDNY